MIRLIALSALVLASSARAAAPAPAKPEAKEKPAAAAPAEPAPAATPAPATEAPPPAVAEKVEREQLKREVLDEVKKALDKQKEEVRDEVRAQVATQTANRALEEEFQFHEEKKKLELFELNGFYRVRPELFHKFHLGRGDDPGGFNLFPKDAQDPARNTLADANMRWRLEPTLNISEDVRVHAQIDLLDNLILGSTPDGGFGLRAPFSVLGTGQEPPQNDKNWVKDSILVRRVYGEVNTPVGQFLFGRMGSQWGMGILHNSGNGVDSDYGDTVDRFMFVAKVADHYIVPMVDFVAEGPSSAQRRDLMGQPFDQSQLDDATDYSLAVARRDTDLEVTRKLQAGQSILNYGAYFTYRRQSTDAADFYRQNAPYADPAGNLGFLPRDASLYIPDVWVKFQTKKLKLELELAGQFGSIGNASLAAGDFVAGEDQSVKLVQFGGAATGSYKVLDALDIAVEVGFASGDDAAGMGNLPGRGATGPGSIDGAQYCVTATCAARDNTINNFRFNRDYRVDLILWREIFDGVTDAFYLKPGVKYEITEGLGVWANVIYSRAIYGQSTPSSHLVDGVLKGDENLGVEIDGGVRYDSGDGFMAGIAYGVLFPLGGLKNNIPATPLDAQTAQTVRGWFVVKY